MAADEGVATAAAPWRAPAHARAAVKVIVGAGFAVAGALTAPVAALVSRMCWRTGAVTVPYGLLLSAAGSVALVVLARAFSRHYAFATAVAWLVGLALVMRTTSGGGFLVAGDSLGWAFVLLDTAAVLTALLWSGRWLPSPLR